MKPLHPRGYSSSSTIPTFAPAAPNPTAEFKWKKKKKKKKEEEEKGKKNEVDLGNLKDITRPRFARVETSADFYVFLGLDFSRVMSLSKINIYFKSSRSK